MGEARSFSFEASNGRAVRRHRAWHWSQGVHSLGPAVGQRHEGPSPGPSVVLRRRERLAQPRAGVREVQGWRQAPGVAGLQPRLQPRPGAQVHHGRRHSGQAAGAHRRDPLPGLQGRRLLLRVQGQEDPQGAVAATSSLMGMFEKNRCKKFLEFCQAFDPKDQKTHKKFDMSKVTMEEVFKEFGLDAGTIDFLGHAVALYRDDAYLKEPAVKCIERVQMYWEGIARYEKSPYIYPLYGLGELPQAFARLAAIYGGTYMLNKQVTEIV